MCPPHTFKSGPPGVMKCPILCCAAYVGLIRRRNFFGPYFWPTFPWFPRQVTPWQSLPPPIWGGGGGSHLKKGGPNPVWVAPSIVGVAHRKAVPPCQHNGWSFDRALHGFPSLHALKSLCLDLDVKLTLYKQSQSNCRMGRGSLFTLPISWARSFVVQQGSGAVIIRTPNRMGFHFTVPVTTHCPLLDTGH